MVYIQLKYMVTQQTKPIQICCRRGGEIEAGSGDRERERERNYTYTKHYSRHENSDSVFNLYELVFLVSFLNMLSIDI